jgi:hypothetical protein
MVHKKEPALICFPNPAGSVLNIAWNAPGAAFIRISSLEGKIVEEIKTEGLEGVLNFDARFLKPAMYVITLFSGNKEIIASTKVSVRF